MVDPSAEKQRELKCAASLFFFAEILSSSPFPPPRSLLPSIVPTCVPVLVSKVTICPTKVATLTICPSGLQAKARPSLPRAIASLVALVPTASQILSDLSQDTVANWVEVGEGENALLVVLAIVNPMCSSTRDFPNIPTSRQVAKAWLVACTGSNDVTGRPGWPGRSGIADGWLELGPGLGNSHQTAKEQKQIHVLAHAFNP